MTVGAPRTDRQKIASRLGPTQPSNVLSQHEFYRAYAIVENLIGEIDHLCSDLTRDIDNLNSKTLSSTFPFTFRSHHQAPSLQIRGKVALYWVWYKRILNGTVRPRLSCSRTFRHVTIIFSKIKHINATTLLILRLRSPLVCIKQVWCGRSPFACDGNVPNFDLFNVW
jgi:hypothetical protein